MQGETPHPSPTPSSGESRLLTRAGLGHQHQILEHSTAVLDLPNPSHRGGRAPERWVEGSAVGGCWIPWSLLQAVVGSVPVAWVSVEGARTHGLRGGGVIYFLSWDG